jgi:putative transposase
MDKPDNKIARTSGMNTWRAGCGESRTSGSASGPEKPTDRKAAGRSGPTQQRVMLYRFVDDQKAEGFPVERICDVVCVSTSAYYDWKKHRCGIATVGELAEQRLVKHIREIHGDSGGTYGEPRVTEALTDEGCVVNHKRVERLMRIHNIVGYTPTKRKVTTIPDAAHRIPDRIRRDFFPDDLDVKWCGDISYIPTWEGFLYLSFVEDLASRRIVGLSMASHMRAELVGDALTEAVGTRGGDVTGVIFHSDRGTQYTSSEFGELCNTYKILQSVGRTGSCLDNAPAESFLATLKKELVHRTTFRTQREARLAIRHWIESWYNQRRLSSVIGYQSPIEWENNYHQTATTKAA